MNSRPPIFPAAWWDRFNLDTVRNYLRGHGWSIAKTFHRPGDPCAIDAWELPQSDGSLLVAIEAGRFADDHSIQRTASEMIAEVEQRSQLEVLADLAGLTLPDLDDDQGWVRLPELPVVGEVVIIASVDYSGQTWVLPAYYTTQGTWYDLLNQCLCDDETVLGWRRQPAFPTHLMPASDPTSPATKEA